MSFDPTVCPFINHDNNDLDKPMTITSTTESSIPSTLPLIITDESNQTNEIQSLSEIEIYVEENPNENDSNNEQISDEIIIDTVEGSEEEIQKQQIANIYRLLNDQHLINNWTATDFLEQLKMYGLQASEEDELEIL